MLSHHRCVCFCFSFTCFLVGYGAFSLSYILWVSQWFAQLPFAVVTLPEFSVWYGLSLYTLIAAGFLYFKNGFTQTETSTWTVVEETENPVDFSGEKSTGRDTSVLPKIFR